MPAHHRAPWRHGGRTPAHHRPRPPSPPTPAKRPSFKIPREAALTFVWGVAFLCVAQRLPGVVEHFVPRAPPSRAAPVAAPTLEPQPWVAVARRERLPSLFKARRNADAVEIAGDVFTVSRHPRVDLARNYATDADLEELREAFPRPFAAFDALAERADEDLSDGSAPVATWTVMRRHTRGNALENFHARILDVFDYNGGAIEGGLFELYDAGGAPGDARELRNVEADRSPGAARAGRARQLTVYLTAAPGAFPYYPFAQEVEYDVHDLKEPPLQGASKHLDQGEPMRPCESVLNGGDPYFRRLDALRPENASARGGRPYWEGLAPDVDYDVDDAARFEERYEAALDEAATKKDGSRRVGAPMISFHDGLADEFRRGGHLGRFCAWLAFHRYQRVCDTRSLAHLALRAGDAVLVDVETPYDAARKKRTDPKEQGTVVPSKMRMWAPGGPAHLLRGDGCGRAPRLVYTAYLRDFDGFDDHDETNATEPDAAAALEEAFADNAESEEQQCCPQQCVPNPQPQCS